MKWMLNLGPNTGFGVFKLPDQSAQFGAVQQLTLARLHGNVLGHRRPLAFLPRFNPLIAGIAKCRLLCTVQ